MLEFYSLQEIAMEVPEHSYLETLFYFILDAQFAQIS